MSKFDYENFNKRYDKFKKNNLPTPFWDEERQTIEYVFFDKDKYCNEEIEQMHVYSNLKDALEKITYASLYFSYTSKNIIFYKENGKMITKTVVGHSHAHSFDEVVKALYYSPESFNISKDEEQYYSTQQLKYLKRVQNYLLLIGLKDVEKENVSVTRYRNKLHKKYQNAHILKLNDNEIKQIINGKIDFWISKHNNDKTEIKKYKSKEQTALVIDEDDNFKILIEYTISEVKEYKDIKDIYKNKNIKDNELIKLTYFKILEIFK